MCSSRGKRFLVSYRHTEFSMNTKDRLFIKVNSKIITLCENTEGCLGNEEELIVVTNEGHR